MQQYSVKREVYGGKVLEGDLHLYLFLWADY